MVSEQAEHAIRKTFGNRFGQIVTSLSVVLLYAVLFSVGRYPLTVGGLLCAAAIILAMRRCSAQPIPLLIGGLMLVWPFIVVAISHYVEATLTPDAGRFIASYALWAVSVITITFAAITWTPLRLGLGTLAITVIMMLMLWQGIGARIFGSAAGYHFVAPLFAFDIFDSYLGLKYLASARAIGSFYEPSMCARVIGTLCFIDVLLRRRLARNVVVLGVTLVLTQSLGLVVLMGSLGLILLGRSAKELFALTLASALLSLFAASSIADRISSPDTGESSRSVYVRTQAPLDTVNWALKNYTLGMPIGAAEALTEHTGYAAATGEKKITNGIYEFITYFGILGIGAIAAALIYVVFAVITGERERASAMMYLILSTALSGSFLSIESSLLTYLFIVAARDARRIRINNAMNLRRT